MHDKIMGILLRDVKNAAALERCRLKPALLWELIGRGRIGIANQDALVVEREFRRLPFGLGSARRERCRLKPALQRLHGVEVGGRIGRWRDVDDPFRSSLKLRAASPEAVDPEEEVDSSR